MMHATTQMNAAPYQALSRTTLIHLAPGRVLSLRRCWLLDQLPTQNAWLSVNGLRSGICTTVPSLTTELQGGTTHPRHYEALFAREQRCVPCPRGIVRAATRGDVLSSSNYRQDGISALHGCCQLHGNNVNSQRLRLWNEGLPRLRLCCSARSVVTRSTVIATAKHTYASAGKSMGGDDAWQMSQELKERWSLWVDNLNRQSAIQAREQLDFRWHLGMHPDFKDNRGKTIPNAPLYRSAKIEDPEAVALIQTGKLYQAIGLDAVLLMEHAGLSRTTSSVPTVNLSAEALRETVEELAQKGMSVAVWEVAADVSKPRIGTSSARYRTRLVSPDRPFMLEGHSGTSEERWFDLPNVVGVSMTSTRGCMVYVLDQNSCEISVYEGLGDDGIWGVITADTSQRAVVHLHKPLNLPKQPRHGPDAPDMERRYVMMKRRLQSRIKLVLEYQSMDGLEGFKQSVKKTGFPEDKEIMHRPAWDLSAGQWPGVRPLYLSTSLQLGLDASPGIPALADYLLPKEGIDKSGKLIRQMLVSWLKNPPPHAVATAVRQVLRIFRDDLTTSILPFMVGAGVDPKTLNVLLQKREGNERTFWALQRTLTQVQNSALDPANNSDCCDQTVPILQQIVRGVWPALCHIMSCDTEQLSQQQVLAATQQALLDIEEVVADESVLYGSNSRQGSQQQGIEAQLSGLANNMQRYTLRVNPHVIAQEIQQVEKAFAELSSTVTALLDAAQEGARRSSIKGDLPRLHVDIGNSAVWLKMPARVAEQLHSVSLSGHGQQMLMKATDRNGGKLKTKNLFTCELLEERLTAYTDAVDDANAAATRALKGLSGKLAITQQELTAAVQLGILLQMLCDHSRAAKDAQWSIPAVGRDDQLQAGVSAEVVGDNGLFDLKELSPYWMTRHRGSKTITNNITLSGMMMLTGPNMAGKSTVLRSVAAAALCASVGLYIPARNGSLVPHLDAVMLRTFSGDAPLEGLSAYAVEMLEMRYVISDASSRSLVLVDELGKGTEVEQGTAIASTLFQQLVAKKAYGIFATHLHGLLELLKDVDGISKHSMQVIQEQLPDGTSALVPTRRIVPGVCTRSLAFDVARQQGVPLRVLQRAQEDYDRLLKDAEYQTPSPAAAATTADRCMRTTAAQGEFQQVGGGMAANSHSSRSTMKSSAASSRRPISAMFQERLWLQARQVQIMLARVRAGDPPVFKWFGSVPEDPLPHELSASGAAGIMGVRHLRPGYGPPPMDHHEPVVYAVRYATNIWHVGESKDIALRWRQHQRKRHKEELVLLQPEMWYVVLETQDDEVRKKRQAELAEAMNAACFPLDSLYDTHYKRRK